MDCSKRDKHLGHVSIETSAEKLCDIYNNWAPSFNQDIEDEVKYVGHLSIAEFLGNHIESSMRPGQKVIDVGAGTGLVGLVMEPLGYQQIDAFDFSSEMLAEAAKLNIYKNLFQGDVNSELRDIPKDYDLAVSAGMFTLGHVTALSVPNILKLLKPNGLFAFTVRSDVMEDEELRMFYKFPDFLEDLEKEHKIKIIDRQDGMPYHKLPGKLERLLHCTIYLCQKLGI